MPTAPSAWCPNPNFGTTVYKNTTDWMDALAKTGASYFRGLYAEGITATKTTTASARAHKIQWGMTVCPEDWALTHAGLIKRINHIADNAADVCLYIEGVNEPNHERDGSKAPSDWVQRTIQKQRIIWNTVKSYPKLSHVKVVGPSLHAVAATEADYAALGRAGLANFMDFAGLHRYPNGQYPDLLIDEKIAWVNKYWGGKRVWITETGYSNSIGAGTGVRTRCLRTSARGTPRPPCSRPSTATSCKVAWYELLDDPDSGSKNVRESNFGMFTTESLARAPRSAPKPVVASMRQILDTLRDDGLGYSPKEIPLRITSAAKDLRDDGDRQARRHRDRVPASFVAVLEHQDPHAHGRPVRRCQDRELEGCADGLRRRRGRRRPALTVSRRSAASVASRVAGSGRWAGRSAVG